MNKISDITIFVENIKKAKGVADHDPDASIYNRLFKENIKIANRVRARDPELKSFLPLLSHEDSTVRCRAAGLLLADHAPEAVAALESLCANGGVSSFDAEMLLKEYRAGRHNPNWWKED